MIEAKKAAGIDRLLMFTLAISLIGNVMLTYKMHRASVALLGADKDSAHVITNAEMTEMSAQDAPSWGNSNAPVTVVVFSDFQCIYCRQFATTLSETENKVGEKMRVVAREMPLPIHPLARREAELAMCVERQSVPAFWELSNYLFEETFHSAEELTVKGETLMGQRSDLDVSKLKDCVLTHQGSPQVDHDLKLAERIGVNGTPTVFVNGVRVGNQVRDTISFTKYILEKADAAHR